MVSVSVLVCEWLCSAVLQMVRCENMTRCLMLQDEWTVDSRGEGSMSFLMFANALFELVGESIVIRNTRRHRLNIVCVLLCRPMVRHT